MWKISIEQIAKQYGEIEKEYLNKWNKCTPHESEELFSNTKLPQINLYVQCNSNQNLRGF